MNTKLQFNVLASFISLIYVFITFTFSTFENDLFLLLLVFCLLFNNCLTIYLFLYGSINLYMNVFTLY